MEGRKIKAGKEKLKNWLKAQVCLRSGRNWQCCCFVYEMADLTDIIDDFLEVVAIFKSILTINQHQIVIL
jgi:hypothetical protein